MGLFRRDCKLDPGIGHPDIGQEQVIIASVSVEQVAAATVFQLDEQIFSVGSGANSTFIA